MLFELAILQREIELVCTKPEKIREALIKYYGTADEPRTFSRKELERMLISGWRSEDG
jgi:hypothetical protein